MIRYIIVKLKVAQVLLITQYKLINKFVTKLGTRTSENTFLLIDTYNF